MIAELAGIEAFVRTAEERSFRRAAERLELTPAAISKAVAKLESRLGVQLLERTSRRVTLTPEGSAYLPHCRVALDALMAGRETLLDASRVPGGTLRASIPFILGPAVVRALPRLVARHPRLTLDLKVTDRYVQLQEEDIDIAVRIGELSDSSLVARRLRRPRWVTVASPSYLAKRGAPRTPADLAHHTCLKFSRPRGGVVEWQFAKRPGDKGQVVVLPTSHRIDQGDLLVEAAVAGIGVAQAFDFLVEAHLVAGRLVEVLPKRWAAGPSVHALCRPRRHSTPKVRAFLDLLTETLAARPQA